jgi:hypothetical protein
MGIAPKKEHAMGIGQEKRGLVMGIAPKRG